MRELIERLEKAKAGGRELDRDLAKLIDRAEWDKCANWASMPCGAPPDTIDRVAAQWLPHYTTSLDAALALAERVLPGWDWSVSGAKEPIWGYGDEREGSPRATLRRRGDPVPNEGLSIAHANTPALALCIAILRALRTTEQHSPAQQKKED